MTEDRNGYTEVPPLVAQAWRSSSGATENRNTGSVELPDGWLQVASSSEVAEDRNFGVGDFASPLARWRSPFGAAEDRNRDGHPVWEGPIIAWRSPFGAAEDHTASTNELAEFGIDGGGRAPGGRESQRLGGR
ncbi:hypothetical protein [Streptomyces anulatus]|uniref:hypothetical protein n=1 Tax=Streptomyces anulatus TaxID=1892 RepID=UPI002E348BCD|nr:hypothetical protein [Streptomyces anulatus]